MTKPKRPNRGLVAWVWVETSHKKTVWVRPQRAAPMNYGMLGYAGGVDTFTVPRHVFRQWVGWTPRAGATPVRARLGGTRRCCDDQR